jgi:hypothetical protein
MNPIAKVGDFPIGSLESRAAARILLGQRWSKRERVQFFYSIRGPWRGEGPEPPDVPRANPWVEGDDGILFRMRRDTEEWRLFELRGKSPSGACCATLRWTA